MPDDELDFGAFEADCQGCDAFASVDDLCLCAECSAKLDRDMIRQCAWAYSATAFGVPAEKYEELRVSTIARYGAALELIASDSEPTNPRAPRRRNRRRQWGRGR